MDLSNDDLDIFGQLDRDFKAILKEYFSEHGIRTKLK